MDDLGQSNPLKGLGYTAGALSLSPRSVQKKDEKTPPKKSDKDKGPKFDMWKLTPEVQALLIELRKADKKRTEAILTELVSKKHNVPKATVKAVIEANKKWYSTTWGAIKSGSWHTVGTDDKGNITHVFKLDDKGLGWENADHKVDIGIKDGVDAKYTNKDKNYSIGAGYKKDRGTVDVTHGTKKDGLHEYHAEGGPDGGGAGYKHTKGDVSHHGTADYTTKGGTHSVGGVYEHKDGKDREKVSVTGHGGTKDGANVGVEVDRKGYSVKVAADGSRTETEKLDTDTAGANVTYTHKKDKKKGEKPKPGDTVTVNVKARVKNTDNNETGAGATTVTTGGSVKAGNTTASTSYENSRGSDDKGNGFAVDDIKANFGQKFVLDPKLASSFSLGLGGHLRFSDKAGEDDIYTGTLTGVWTRGKKDDKREFNFKLHGGQTSLASMGSLAYTNPAMFKSPDKGYGNFGHLGLGYGHGQHKLKLDATLGATDNTTIAGGHLGYAYGKKHSVDLYASMAKQDADVGSLFRLNSSIALGKKLKLTPGGSLILKPTDEGYTELWAAHTGLGINLKKGMDLTFKMGVAGDGQQIYYVPEAMYDWKDKFSVGAMANIGSKGDYGLGAKLKIPKADLTVFGGYGTTDMLTKPYLGNGGMSVPAMDDKWLGAGSPRAGGMIGVSWNALPTINKVVDFFKK